MTSYNWKKSNKKADKPTSKKARAAFVGTLKGTKKVNGVICAAGSKK
jgi:hypothetical protein